MSIVPLLFANTISDLNLISRFWSTKSISWSLQGRSWWYPALRSSQDHASPIFLISIKILPSRAASVRKKEKLNSTTLAGALGAGCNRLRVPNGGGAEVDFWFSKIERTRTAPSSVWREGRGRGVRIPGSWAPALHSPALVSAVLLHCCTVCQCVGALVLWCSSHPLLLSFSAQHTWKRLSSATLHNLEHIATQSHQPYKKLCVRNTRSAKSRHSRCSGGIIEPMNLLSNNQLTIVWLTARTTQSYYEGERMRWMAE